MGQIQKLPIANMAFRLAPKTAVREPTMETPRSTQISHCTKRGLSPAHLTLARLLSGIIESAH